MDLLGKEVVELNGSLIGTIKNVMFDEKAWQVGSFDVQLDENVAKEFEMKKVFRNYRFPSRRESCAGNRRQGYAEN